MTTPHAIVLRAPGTNCDDEATHALELAGGTAQKMHILALREKPETLRDAQILVIPGGFSYGDDVAAGKILANQMKHFLRDHLHEFRAQEKLILGICNGFQVLLKAGLLVPPDDEGPVATLAHNERGYTDRWVHLKVASQKSPFLTGINRLHIPIAHGEGNFAARKEWILTGLAQTGQIALRYTDPSGNTGAGFPHNPNGSQDDIAGITDASGRVLGLMPHPERHLFGTQHPQWTRLGLIPEGDGFALFRNAVTYFA